jgi:osmotically-inducible protein OsmY
MTDHELQQRVENALDWADPSVDASGIAVIVDGGVVTLRGGLQSYTEKATAERVALLVYGVKAVANDLEVRVTRGLEPTDTEIAQAAVNALNQATTVPEGALTVTVSDGWLTLKGTVAWQYQKGAAARTVRDLTGVRGVTDGIVVLPHPTVGDVRAKIEAAFRRTAEVDARCVNVNVLDGQVILSGNVHSWFEREEARRAAWAAPGVTTVVDRLAVVPIA